MAETVGKVVGVNGNMVTVEVDTNVRMNEVGYVVVGDHTGYRNRRCGGVYI